VRVTTHGGGWSGEAGWYYIMILCRRRVVSIDITHVIGMFLIMARLKLSNSFGYLLQNHTASPRSRRLMYPTLRRRGNAMMKHLREE